MLTASFVSDHHTHGMWRYVYRLACGGMCLCCLRTLALTRGEQTMVGHRMLQLCSLPSQLEMANVLHGLAWCLCSVVLCNALFGATVGSASERR
jgi:hypothetical protein